MSKLASRLTARAQEEIFHEDVSELPCKSHYSGCHYYPRLGQAPASTVYLDPTQPINVRVDDLIKRMTLEEKAHSW